MLLCRDPQMVDTELIVATSNTDPTQSAPPRWWVRSLRKPWLAAVILVLLAIGHGKFEYVRWVAMERARNEEHARRAADADKAKTLAEAAAATRRADEETKRTVLAEAEALKVATPMVLPELDQQPLPGPARSAALSVAVMPGPPCDGAEAAVAVEQRCLRHKDSFKDCPECPEMVVIPAGEVMMGSPSHEEGRASNEGPQHRVTIEKRFAASKFETTFEEWEACLLAGACKHAPNDQGWGKGRRPVIDVSWADAKEYVAWLSKKTSLRYRLLTEAEWEYAARAGTTTAFSIGETITSDDANFDGSHTHGGGGKDQYRKNTVEVGSFRSNAFGLYDMHGNVWEWVEDCWHTDYNGGPGNGSAWTDRCNERTRVLRGGSWIDTPRILRSAYRSRNMPVYRGGSVGLRVARTLD
jgi:formylglycine-generating enzyme required for sulfatase activity